MLSVSPGPLRGQLTGLGLLSMMTPLKGWYDDEDEQFNRVGSTLNPPAFGLNDGVHLLKIKEEPDIV